MKIEQGGLIPSKFAMNVYSIIYSKIKDKSLRIYDV